MKCLIPWFILMILVLRTNFLQSQDIKSYKWKNRIIILTDTTAALSNSFKELNRFSPYSKELLERDVILMLYHKGKLFNSNNTLLYSGVSIAIEPGFCGSILIGKDGEIKFKSVYPTDPKSIFELIDGMPMRKAEMKSKQ
ncbi:DUF4174 domain-containing protein [Maribacter sp. CXY002]|uniref:DUF4174 domain-containing protein n=1 Tax=Maribacter luteocoastalis TaxID=3407671 RepID=UPI003B66DD25